MLHEESHTGNLSFPHISESEIKHVDVDYDGLGMKASVDEDAAFWELYCQEADVHDKEVLKQWNAAMDSMLIFAGLFSAINTAFIVESYKSLTPGIDPESDSSTKLTNKLLLLILNNLDNSTINRVDLIPRSSACSSHDLFVNQLFFSSLLSSLVSAFGAVLGKQWLNNLSRMTDSATAEARGRERQIKWSGLKKYHFKGFMEILPACLHVSLFLFLIGLIEWLRPLNPAVSFLVIGFSGSASCVYVGTVILAAIFPDCPYQTPISPLIRRIINSLRGSRRYLSIMWKAGIASVREVVTSYSWYQMIFVPFIIPVMVVIRAFHAVKSGIPSRVVATSDAKDPSEPGRSRTGMPLSQKSRRLYKQALGWMLKTRASSENFIVATTKFLEVWESSPETWCIIKEGAVLPRLAALRSASAGKARELLHTILRHLAYTAFHSQAIGNDSYEFLKIMVEVLRYTLSRDDFSTSKLVVGAISIHMTNFRALWKVKVNFPWPKYDFILILKFLKHPCVDANDLTAGLNVIKEAQRKRKLDLIQEHLPELRSVVLRVLDKTPGGDESARALLLCFTDWLQDNQSVSHRQLYGSSTMDGFTKSIMRHVTDLDHAEAEDIDWYLELIEKFCRKDVIHHWALSLAQEGHFALLADIVKRQSDMGEHRTSTTAEHLFCDLLREINSQFDGKFGWAQLGGGGSIFTEAAVGLAEKYHSQADRPGQLDTKTAQAIHAYLQASGRNLMAVTFNFIVNVDDQQSQLHREPGLTPSPTATVFGHARRRSAHIV